MLENGNSKRKMDQLQELLNRKWLKISCLFLLGMTATIASVSLAFDGEKETAHSKEPGLYGILVDEAPEDLSAEEFAMLDGNWEKWSEGVAELVADLYEDDSLGVQGQRNQIAHLRIKINTMETALNSSAYSAIFDELTMMHGRLVRRVDFAEAILDTLEQDPKANGKQQIEQTAAQLRVTASSTENTLYEYVNGSAWAPYLKLDALKQTSGNSGKSLQVALNVQKKLANRNALKDASQKVFLNRPFLRRLHQSIDSYLAAVSIEGKPINKEKLRQLLTDLVEATDRFSERGLTEDVVRIENILRELSTTAADRGARINAVVNKYYRNNNLHLAVGESLLNRLLGDSKTDRSNIDDCFMGARSIGLSDTSVFVTVDLVPNDGAAMFNLVLNGTSTTSTTSYAQQAEARIAATGYHTFYATRGLLFDGDYLTTLGTTATMNVNPSIRINGAGTKYDGIPLIGSYARKKAYKTALSRRGASARHAADKIRERVLPEFNIEVQTQVSKMNNNLAGGLNQRLKKLNLFPQQKSYRSTSNQLLATSLISGKNELGGSTPNYGSTSVTGLTIGIHQSLLNNALDRVNLAGKTLSDDQFKAEIQSFLSELTGKDLSLSKKAFEDGKPTDKKESSQFIFAKQNPIRVKVQGGELILTLRCGFKQDDKDKKDIPQHIISVPLTFQLAGDTLEIKRGTVKVSAADRKDRSIPVAGVIRKKISNSIPGRQSNRNVTIHREGKSDVVIRIHKVKALNGWLSFEAI